MTSIGAPGRTNLNPFGAMRLSHRPFLSGITICGGTSWKEVPPHPFKNFEKGGRTKIFHIVGASTARPLLQSKNIVEAGVLDGPLLPPSKNLYKKGILQIP